MRLKDADVLIQRFKERAGCRACNNYYGVQCRACLWNDAINIVDETPTVEKMRPYYGYWVKDERENHWHCSRCKAVQGIACKAMRYCPHCGAEMEQ